MGFSVDIWNVYTTGVLLISDLGFRVTIGTMLLQILKL